MSSILDNISRTETDTTKAVSDNAILAPGVFSQCCIVVINKGDDSEKCIKILKNQISYLFSGYDYQFDISDDIEYRYLASQYYFTYDENNVLIIIQFNNRKSDVQTIKMYMRLFMCIESSYIEIEANASYISDLISLYTTAAHPDVYARDYSTKSYTLGIVWKYYYIKSGLGEFKHITHLVNCIYHKLWPASQYDKKEDKIKKIEYILKHKVKYVQHLRQTGE